jgi:hypothetical protein
MRMKKGLPYVVLGVTVVAIIAAIVLFVFGRNDAEAQSGSKGVWLSQEEFEKLGLKINETKAALCYAYVAPK